MRVFRNIFTAIITIALSCNIIYAQGRIRIVSPQSNYISPLVTALSSARDGDIIFIKNGTYTLGRGIGNNNNGAGIVVSRKNISLIGESRDGVIITGENYNGKTKPTSGVYSTTDCYTLAIEGEDFYAENLTIRNTYYGAQAVALRTNSDKVVFKNCSIEGYQDTHYADGGRQYMYDCSVSGTVDFIFGDAAIMYDNSTVICRQRSGGYITAPADAKNGYRGILINNSSVVGEDGLADDTYHLGRPWKDNSYSVFANCKLGSQIKLEGWQAWPENNIDKITYMAEYKSMNLDGTPADVSQRVSWSHQLTDSEMEKYSVENYFEVNGLWDPRPLLNAPSAPSNVRIADNEIIWNEVEGAKGYLILRNDSLIASDTLTYYNTNGIEGNYSVKAFNQNGALSEASSIATGLKFEQLEKDIYVIGDILYVPQNEKVEIYNLMGNLVKVRAKEESISITDLRRDIYIVKVILNKKGDVVTQKILK